MTDDDKRKLDDLHRFLMFPRAPGKPSRAEELDDALTAIRAGRLGTRALLWLSGLITAVAAAWITLKGGGK